MSDLPLLVFIIGEIFCLFVISVVFKLVFKQMPVHPDSDTIYVTILAIVFAPFIETFAFQLIPIEVSQFVFRSYFRKRFQPFSIVISSFIFAIVHCYNIYYMIYAFLVGILMSSAYMIKMGKSIVKPFVAVYAAHLIWNILSVLFRH